MSDSNHEVRITGDDSADPVGDAIVHGLLVALEARERREAPSPRRKVGGRRLVPAAIAAALLLATAVTMVMLGRPASATAQTVIAMAVAHSGGPGCRVYDVVIDPEGDGIGRGSIEGRIFLEGGPGSRMAAQLRVGPLLRRVRFGVDDAGSWIDSPAGVRRGPDGTPLLRAILGGLDDRTLRMDAVLARCSEAHDIVLLPSGDDSWTLSAIRRAGRTESILDAEFLIRRHDGAVVEARLEVESPGGYRADVLLSLNDDVVATEQDLTP